MVVHLEHLEVMAFLEDEATQSCLPCLEDRAATECNVVIGTCRRLIQVRKKIFPSYLILLGKTFLTGAF